MNYLPLFYLSVTVTLTSVAQLLQKQAAIDLNQQTRKASLLSNLNFMLSGVLLGIALITWLQVLNSLEVSIAYPLLSLNYILVLIQSRSMCFARNHISSMICFKVRTIAKHAMC